MRRQHLFFAVSTVLLAVGGVCWAVDARDAADVIWAVDAGIGLVVSLASTASALARRRPTVDVIALLALAGALAVGEPFAGAVIAVMLASGQLLDERAAARATRELSALVARAPRTARRYVDGDGASGGELSIEEVPIEDVRIADRVVVRPGEVVPVDGRLLVAGVFDEAALSGESREVERERGERIRSGVVNAGHAVDITVTNPAEESTYAGLVRLVREAEQATAPFVRIADRLAVLLVPVTLAVAAFAWAMSGDAVRAVAVLVVATPCPLLLAAPIALISGVSRAASNGVIVKGGGALEQLAAGRTMLFDKTGTLTRGRPQVVDVVTASPDDDQLRLLRLAASVEQLSAHVFAAAFATAAARHQLSVGMPTGVHEVPGYGVSGTVDGHEVMVGKPDWVLGDTTPAWARRARRRADLDGSSVAFVAVDGEPAGAVLLRDPVRPDGPRMIRALRDAGISRVVLLTGDRPDVAESVGRVVGVDAVVADADPADKLTAVRRETASAPTIMVGDGVNDAPALAAAGAGVALAARGATASSEAADVVLTADRIDALADAMLTARRAKAIATQAVVIGMGMSLAAMGFAAVGLLPPAAGALLQEGIDVAAILIALRAVLPGPRHTIALPEADLQTAQRLRSEHETVRGIVDRLRSVADTLTTSQPDLGALVSLVDDLETALLPHERAEEEELLPIVARALRSRDAIAGLSRTHAEIEHHVRRLRRLLSSAGVDPDADDVVEARRLLYGLHAVLELHNAEEDELAFALLPDEAAVNRAADSRAIVNA